MEMIMGRMDLAVKYGADVSIFLHNLVYWVEKNAANKVNYFDGRYWTYNSMRAMSELYPLWSRDQIKRLVKKCEELGVILIGNYNTKSGDRTLWYTPSDEVLILYGLGNLVPEAVAKSPRPCGETAPPIGRNRPNSVAKSPHPCGEIAPPLPRSNQEETQEDTQGCESSLPSPKPKKKQFGTYRHVRLTDQEFELLGAKYGAELRDKAIRFLDEYIEEKGYKSKSHNLAIQRWVIDAVKERTAKRRPFPGNSVLSPPVKDLDFEDPMERYARYERVLAQMRRESETGT